jgi:hypothetical protein
MAGELGFPFEVGYSFRKVSFRDLHTGSRDPWNYWRCRHRDLGRSLLHKPGRSSRVWMRSSKVVGVADKASGPTCRSAGLLAGRVHLTGTFGTLVGGDPWVATSHRDSPSGLLM